MERKRINLSIEPDDYAIADIIAKRKGLTVTTMAAAALRKMINAEKSARAVKPAKEE